MRLLIIYILFIFLTGCQTSKFIGCQNSKKAMSIVNSLNCNEGNGLIYRVELITLSETDNLYSNNNFHFLGNDINAVSKQYLSSLSIKNLSNLNTMGLLLYLQEVVSPLLQIVKQEGIEIIF